MLEILLTILISTVVGFISGFLLSCLRDYLKNQDMVKKCKGHINFDLNAVLGSKIKQFKIYSVYLRRFENKTLWNVFQKEKIYPVFAMNLSMYSSQFELFEIVKHSEILSLILSEDLQRVTTIQTHLRMLDERSNKIIMKEVPSITEEIFYQETLEMYLKKKINVYENSLFTIIKNCKHISWMKFNKENQEFIDSLKINSESKSIFEDLEKEY